MWVLYCRLLLSSWGFTVVVLLIAHKITFEGSQKDDLPPAKVKGSYDFELSKIQPVSWAVRRCQAATTGSQTESTRGKAPLSHGQTTASTSLISRTQMKACTTHLSVATQRWQLCWNRSSRQLASEWMQGYHEFCSTVSAATESCNHQPRRHNKQSLR